MKRLVYVIVVLMINSALSLGQGYYSPKGFKSFADATVGVSDDVTLYSSANAGYQLNRVLFLGFGAGVGIIQEPYWDSIDYSTFVPVYGCARFNILDKMVTPYIDTRVGRIFTKDYKLYVSTSVGCRVKLRKVALCLSEGVDVCTCNYEWGSENYYTKSFESEKENDVIVSAITRFTIEF